eukprot:3635462-Rhodomonas_salina.2
MQRHARAFPSQCTRNVSGDYGLDSLCGHAHALAHAFSAECTRALSDFYRTHSSRAHTLPRQGVRVPEVCSPICLTPTTGCADLVPSELQKQRGRGTEIGQLDRVRCCGKCGSEAGYDAIRGT